MEHWFTLTLEDTNRVFELPTDAEFDDAIGEISDALFEAGCDDGTFFTREGSMYVGFARKAPTFREAATSAIADVESAGYKVTRVSIDPPPELDEINAELTERVTA